MLVVLLWWKVRGGCYNLALTMRKTRLRREEMYLWLETNEENGRDAAHLGGTMGCMPLGRGVIYGPTPGNGWPIWED